MKGKEKDVGAHEGYWKANEQLRNAGSFQDKGKKSREEKEKGWRDKSNGTVVTKEMLEKNVVMAEQA